MFLIRTLQHRLRHHMPRLRPALVIIGAQKAGTTTLFDILAGHPRVLAPKRKEISFFSDDQAYGRGMEAYWAEFPVRPLRPARYVTLDASPMYLYHPKAAARIARHLPKALCLAVLRDPVERAYSAWNMYRSFKGHPRHHALHDPRPFEEAIADQLAGKAEIPARRYLDRGLYAPQLQRYIDHLGPGRLLVRDFALLCEAPGALLNDLLRRLHLPQLPADHPAFTTRSNVRTYDTQLSEALGTELRARFAEDAGRTRELITQHRLGPDAPLP